MPSSGLLNRKENNWEEIRSRGFWRFVLFYGLVIKGIVGGLVCFLVVTILMPSKSVLNNFVMSLVIFSVFGVS